MHPEGRREEEPLIREVETARDGLKGVAKDPDAVWVPGLEPEVAHAHRGHRGGTAHLRKAAASTDSIERPTRGVWLSVPLAFGLLSTAALVMQLSFAPSLFALAFPTEEHLAWPAIKQLTPLDHALDTLPSLLSCVFATSLCVQLGVAADSFACFLGVGVSVLTVLASLGDKVLLLRACPDPSPRAECDLPLVLHWLCNFVKICAPVVAVFATSGVWDMLALYKRSGGTKIDGPAFFAFRAWAWLLLAPLLFHAHHIAHTYWTGAPSVKLASAGVAMQVVAWSVLLFARVRIQPRFEVRAFDPKKHD